MILIVIMVPVNSYVNVRLYITYIMYISPALADTNITLTEYKDSDWEKVVSLHSYRSLCQL